MEQLIAVSSILFESVCYEPGDVLPVHNQQLVEIWTGNGAAVWKDIEEQPRERDVKAVPVTAPAGLPGPAYPSAGPDMDLIGKLPPRRLRGAQPAPPRRRRKSSA
jgi:hypothetical protein